MVRYTYADTEEVADIVKSGKAGKDCERPTYPWLLQGHILTLQ